MTLLFSLLSTLALAGDVTPQNWKTHPEITEVRLLRKEVEAGGRDPAWTGKSKDMTQCAGPTPTNRSVLLDPRGTIRRYKAQGHSAGISFSTTQYYNTDGRLRFVHLRLTHDEKDATTEYTSFLDVHGARLFEHVQRITDDEALLPAGLPESYLVTRPKKIWETRTPCGTQ
jgi:hypothetical protein